MMLNDFGPAFSRKGEPEAAGGLYVGGGVVYICWRCRACEVLRIFNVMICNYGSDTEYDFVLEI